MAKRDNMNLMKIDTMNISLPRPLKAFVQQRVERDGYGNVSEYVRELIRDDQKKRARQRLDDLLLEGLASGGEAPMSKDDWDQLHHRLEERHAAMRKLKKSSTPKSKTRGS